MIQAMLLVPCLVLAPPQAQEARTALVIGNGAYKDAPLKNPVNDAQAVAQALRRCGFAVTLLENASRERMFGAVRDFGAKLNTGGVGLFYFAGHGMQVRGRNFLIPVGADIGAEDEVAVQALDVELVLAKMETARNRLNILVLDACRNNPFGRSFRSSTAGLAPMDAPAGSFIAFATAPGRTAADGSEANGLYTAALLKVLPRPGLKLEEVFKAARSEVLQRSGGAQVPWENSSVVGDFYFEPGAAAPAARADEAALETVFWNGIRDSRVAEDFRAYLARYPEGLFAALARQRLEALAAPAGAPVAATSSPLTPWTNSLGMTFIRVPAGTFLMGSVEGGWGDERPAHRVTLREPFFIGRTEVTQGQWKAVMGGLPGKATGDEIPVDKVSWDDAQAFVRALNAKEGAGRYRLPTEAEWEYACRAGTTTTYFFGNDKKDLDRHAWVGSLGTFYGSAFGVGGAKPVAQKLPNAWGLFDMLGNVWEWCEDVWHKGYEGAPSDGRAWVEGGKPEQRVVRGGGWNHPPAYFRCAHRASFKTTEKNVSLGLRLVAAPK